MSNLKLFDRFTTHDIEIDDISLKPYIHIQTNLIFPHTSSRLQRKFNGKSKIPIIERFACYLMRKGRNCGKKYLAMNAIKDALIIINYLTDKNPLQIFVNALINSGPREDSARVGRGGAIKRTSVDVSPIRRLNIALFLLSKGIRESSFKNIKSLPECIAEEIIAASRNSGYAVKKRDEIERVAKSNR